MSDESVFDQMPTYDVLKTAVLTPVLLSNDDKDVIQDAIDKSWSNHRLKGGGSVLRAQPCLHFFLERDYNIERKPGVIHFFGKRGFFGASFVFSLLTKEDGCLARVHIDRDSDVFHLLTSGNILITLARGKKLVAVRNYDMRGSSALETYLKLHENVANHHARYCCPEAHFWEIVDLTTYLNDLTKSDRLSLGWQRTFSAYILRFLGGGGTLPPDHPLHGAAQNGGAVRPPVPHGDVLHALPDLLRSFVDRSTQTDFRVEEIIEHLDHNIEVDKSYIHRLLTAVLSYLASWDTYVVRLVQVYLHSTRITQCGKRLPWLDGTQLQLLTIEPEGFPPSYSPETYWPNSLESLSRFYWGELISCSDVPVAKEQINKALATFPVAEHAEEAEAAANVLLEEAIANKKWCIPPGAVVELKIGPFELFELREILSLVCFVGRDKTGGYCICGIETRSQNLYFDAATLEENARAGLKLLFAAVVRDFWVVEEREKVFSVIQRSGMAKRGHKDDELTVVYLPRVRYTEIPNVRRCESELGQTERRAHFVSAHLRKADQSSESQHVLAQRYGFVVPKGFTFVRPHERGKKKREVIYRSRSALGSLYTEMETAAPGRSDWFRFERDVYTLMKDLGYTVEHASASKRGDQGIDVFATKGDDLDVVNWVIQCKCYRPNRKVGPGIVRDLVGALTEHPHGTRGMIVTTSSFTRGAREDAERHNIRTMDGAEFCERISTTK